MLRLQETVKIQTACRESFTDNRRELSAAFMRDFAAVHFCFFQSVLNA